MSTDHDNTKKPDALELGTNDVNESYSIENIGNPIYLKTMDPILFPDLSEKFNPLNTSDNTEALRRFYELDIKYNMMSRKIECHADGKNFSLQNKNDCFFTHVSNLCVRNRVPKADLSSHLVYIADQHRYHPAIDWIESKPWDGIDRIKDFVNTITTENQEDSNKLLYRWMIGCIAALYTPGGVSLEGMLVVQGEQKIGKSYWFINLVPKEQRHLIIDGEAINSADKDDVNRVTSRWLVELAELKSTIAKSSVEDFKRFITRSTDTYRKPFGRNDSDFPRMTSLYSSVNDPEFLVDPTGNRRFWCISATHINHSHGMNMQQVWAQFKRDWDNGENHKLTQDEQDIVNENNPSFTTIDPLEEAILDAFNWGDPNRNYPMTASAVLEKVGITLISSQMPSYSKRVGLLLRKITKTKSRKSNGKKVFDMPFCYNNKRTDFVSM